MRQVTVYDYAEGAGELLGQRTVQRHEGVGLPASSTDVAPPASCADGHVLCWQGGAWKEVEDHRGKTVYRKADGVSLVIQDVGTISEDLTLLPCPEFGVWDDANDHWKEDKEAKGDALRARRDVLLNAHADTMNPMRWETLSDAQKDAWRNYRQGLLDVPQQAGFPDAVEWPDAPEI